MYSLSSTASGRYPWGVSAPETEVLQQSLNAQLSQAKLCTIPVTGKLDAATCGAALSAMPFAAQTSSRFLEEWAIAAPNCQQYGPAPNPPCAPGNGHALTTGKSNAPLLAVLGGALAVSVFIVWKLA
jgi:hypothetical protein